MALLSGATLVLTGRSGLQVSESLEKDLKDKKISIVLFPPSILRMLPLGNYPDLKTLIVGGEASTADLINQWVSQCKLYQCIWPYRSFDMRSHCNLY